MKKLLLFALLIFTLLLAACGAPPVDAPPAAPEIIVETVEVEVEVPGPVVYVEVTPTLEIPPFIDDGVLFLPVNHHTVLWEQVGENENGPIFERYQPLIHLAEGDMVIGYSGHGPEEFYRTDDGLALAGPSFPNAQEFVCADWYVLPIWVYDDPGDEICPGKDVRTALYPGRWSGQWIDVEGNLRAETYFYKVANIKGESSDNIPGLFVLADRVDLPSCELLDFPPSCNQ
jgi:hypothetical protein